MRNLQSINNHTPKEMQIAVLGMGHVGLPTALGFAELGWKVVGADQDAEKIRQLKDGSSPFYEPGLQELLNKHLESGTFTVAADVSGAIQSSSILFICVGTPQREDGAADLTQIEVIARLIAQNLNGYKLIVEKSTVPAITALWVKRTITRYAMSRVHADGAEYAGFSPDSFAERIADSFDVASNPEFLQEGKAVENLFHPDRVILGVESRKAEEILKAIYQPLKRPILVTDLTTAELIKHAANAFLAMKISYINMVADVCEAVGANVSMVSLGLGLDPRIGPDFLSAGIGFGGYCFPKDLKAFIRLAEEHSVECSMLKEVERTNQRRIPAFLKKVRDALWIVQGKTIGIWGLAFKPNTDDIREAPSIGIIDSLLKEGARLQVYDPEAMPRMQQIFPAQSGKITYCSSPYQACEGAQALLLLTEWTEFRDLDLQKVRSAMDFPILLDGRNAFDLEKMQEAGLEYISIGRKSVRPSQMGPLTLDVPVASQHGDFAERARS